MLKPYPLYLKSDPKFYLSQNKIPGSPLIFFVHFYGGHQKVLKRHIQLVNDLGFDAFAFNMPSFKSFSLKFFSGCGFGVKHLYAKMIRFFLDQIDGEKIIFSFSNPSASAIEAMVDRNDTKGLVCDSGPSGAFLRSAWNLAMKSPDEPALIFFFAGLWSPKIHFDLASHLSKLPNQFPILSLRGGSDEIIPVWHIQRAFAKNQNHLKITPHVFLEAGHLDALKRFPDEYRVILKQWLSGLV